MTFICGAHFVDIWSSTNESVRSHLLNVKLLFPYFLEPPHHHHFIGPVSKAQHSAYFWRPYSVYFSSIRFTKSYWRHVLSENTVSHCIKMENRLNCYGSNFSLSILCRTSWLQWTEQMKSLKRMFKMSLKSKINTCVNRERVFDR